LKNFSIDEIIGVMKRKGYKVFEKDQINYNLNIVGVRSSDQTPNVFNDRLFVFWKFKKAKVLNQFRITTDPGLYWLKNPMNEKGTAILKPGQYLDIWQIGLHQGKYEALVQTGNFTVIRDFDRDVELDYNSGREEAGIFGINCHHAGENSQTVDKWSAGCQVFATIPDFDLFMDICRKARRVWGNSFSYTLLEERDFE
jgi:hypothetical protein